MKLIVVAASGLAREVLATERELRRSTHIRVVDDDPAMWGTVFAGHPVVGGLNHLSAYDDHHVLVCAGQGRARRDIVRRLAALGVTRERYATVIHPRVETTPGLHASGSAASCSTSVVLTARRAHRRPRRGDAPRDADPRRHRRRLRHRLRRGVPRWRRTDRRPAPTSG